MCSLQDDTTKKELKDSVANIWSLLDGQIDGDGTTEKAKVKDSDLVYAILQLLNVLYDKDDVAPLGEEMKYLSLIILDHVVILFVIFLA